MPDFAPKILHELPCMNHANTLQESGMIFPEHNKILAKSCQLKKEEICQLDYAQFCVKTKQK